MHGRTIRRERGCGRRFEKLTSLWKVKIQSYRVLLGCGTRDIEVHGVPIWTATNEIRTYTEPRFS